MRLSTMLKEISVPCSLVRDGEFQVMEQCDRNITYLTEVEQETVIRAVLEAL